MLARSFQGRIARRAAAALQGAAPLGAATPVDHAAALARRYDQGQAPRFGTSVDAVAAVGKQTGDGQDAGM
ncbi:MAG TPA: hypothetical protein VKD46_01380 [bacterium]|nr:hypothetical protein [bacterium]